MVTDPIMVRMSRSTQPFVIDYANENLLFQEEAVDELITIGLQTVALMKIEQQKSSE